MNIDKDQILQLLKSQGHPQADQAADELPSQVDTESPEHQSMLSKFGIDPNELAGKLGGLGGLGKLL
jgi:hypothetical protein